MFGRKKIQSYFFYPPGGNQSSRYIEPYVYQDFPLRQQGQQATSPYPTPFQAQYGATNWSNTPYPYPMQMNQYPNSYQNNMTSTNSYAGHPYLMNQGFSQTVLQNPLQVPDEPYPPYYQQQMQAGPATINQYPNPAMMPKQSGGMSNIMNSFKSQDGSMDINKMVNTAGQMINALSQVKSMVQGIGGMLKV
ncbi:YppG family protein [Bacillus marasmi]|uniref:YppG family protein n=1 Tax=Bacillus marasmi TaxID=1926279 RepID=UPI001FEBD275|nr:YppG family protein [Bacillus marasmi]